MTTPKTIDEQTFIEAVMQANQGSWDAWISLWAEDAVWHAAGHNPYSGGSEAAMRSSSGSDR